LGTDGTASNNTLDILKEAYTCAITQKGVYRCPEFPRAQTVLAMATENGAMAQGREKCGKLQVGYRADLIQIDLEDVNTLPHYAAEYAVLYSANAANVKLTMADGVILYENGEWKTMDAEALKYEMKEICANYFRD
jgi:5-methylthioadenosine/S-adenosylhomocysteine deaminase